MGLTISYVSFRKEYLDIVSNSNMRLDIKTIQDYCYVFCNNGSDSEKLARKISGKANIFALSFLYFDDDDLVMLLFENGKMAARHYNTHYTKYTGKADVFAAAFRLNEQERKLLKRILKVEDLYDQIRYLEGVIKTPLLLDEEEYSKNPQQYGIEQYPLITADEIEAEMKAKKVKNTKKEKCVFEITTPCRLFSNRSYPYFITRTSDNGAYKYTFCKLDEKNKVIELWFEQSLEEKEIYRFKKTDNGYAYCMNKKVIFTDDNGKIRSEVDLKPGAMVLSVSDDERISCNSNIFQNGYSSPPISQAIRYDNKGGLLFSMIKAEFFHENCLRMEDTIIKIDEDTESVYTYKKEKSVFSKIREERVDYENERCYFTSDNKIWYYYTILKNGEFKSYLQLLDESLNVVDTIMVLDNFFQASIFEDKFNKRILLVGLHEIIPVDITTKTAAKPVKMVSNAVLHVDEKGNIYNRKGNSTLEVYNSDFKLVSVNKLKGYVWQYFGNDADGNPRFLTIGSMNANKDNIFRFYTLYNA